MSKLKWTKKARIAVAVLCIALATAGLVIFSQMNQVAEAAILEPIESPPETIFYDDFSGDLSQWTVMSGIWTIESQTLKGNGSLWTNIVAGEIGWEDYVLEAKVRPTSYYDGTTNTNHAPGILARYKDEGNFLMLYLCQGGTKVFLGRKVAGLWEGVSSASFEWSNDNWYTLKLELAGLTAKAYIDGQYLFTANIPSILANGKIGVEVYNSYSHFDDVRVITSSMPSAYSLNLKSGTTQIVITCTWTGLGNITIENLTSPTETYYESNMSIYERTKVSFDGTTTYISNVKRAMLTIPPLTSSEIWTLYLSLSNIMAYDVDVETS